MMQVIAQTCQGYNPSSLSLSTFCESNEAKLIIPLCNFNFPYICFDTISSFAVSFVNHRLTRNDRNLIREYSLFLHDMRCVWTRRFNWTVPPHVTANFRGKWTFVHFIVAEDWQSNTDSTWYLCGMNISRTRSRLISRNYDAYTKGFKGFFALPSLLR